MVSDYISREAANEACREAVRRYPNSFYNGIEAARDAIRKLPAADVLPVPDGGIGEMSDGYHTFNGLYYQRMVLFAALVKAHKGKAWKSRKHEDGELCFGGGWFIVGIDTPEGSYTYHYEEKDWDLFDCVELPVAKHWDGHTEKDVTRLLSLDVRPVVNTCATCVECGLSRKNYKPQTNADRIRSMTDEELAALFKDHFCPMLIGADMDCQNSCEKCWLDWLREEAQDG